MGLRGTLGRMRADPILALGTLLTVTLSLVLLAAGPIYSDAVAVGALRRSLVDAPASSTVVEMATSADRSEIEAVETLAVGVLDRAFGAVGYEPSASLVSSESFALPDQPDPDRVDLAVVAWLEAVDAQVTLTAGSLPDEQVIAADGAVVEIAVHARAATELGLDVGSRFVVEPRSGGADPLEVGVVGLYEVIDPTAAYWSGRDRLVEPLSVSPAFRTVTLLAPRTSMLAGVSPRPEISLSAVPLFDTIGIDDVQPLRRQLSGLEDTVNTQLGRSDILTSSGFEVETNAPSVLAGRDRTLTVARSVVVAVVLQLAVLGAFALVLVAGLGVDARNAESSMLRARGASATQLVAQAALDAAVVVVPVAVVAPVVATVLVGLLDDIGPLASSGLRIEATAVASSWLVVAIAAVATVVLLTVPALRAARASESSPHHSRRRRLVGPLQRSGVDLAVLAVAVTTYWQLRTLGESRAASVRGRFGVDPLLIAAPTFGLVAGAFLALRVVPAVAKLAERAVARTRAATWALTGWQFARRPHRYSRLSLLLIMAIAIGTFAVTYEATWTRSQAAQAAHEFGADGRLEPNRRTGDSIGALQLPSVIAGVPGIGAAVSVVTETADLPASDRPGRFVAIDAARSDVFNDLSLDRPGLAEGLSALAARRPTVDGLELPGRPTAIELSAVVTPEPETPPPDDPEPDGEDAEPPPPPPPPPPFGATITLLLRDGDGVLHRVDAGPLGTGRSLKTVDLVVEGADGSTASPRHPLAIVAIELSSSAQRVSNPDVVVRLGPVVSIGAGGSRTSVPLVDTELALRTDTFGFLDERPTISYGERPPDDGIALAITSGSSFSSTPVIHTIAARTASSPSVLPGLGTAAWLTDSGTEIGDVVSVSLGRVDDVRVEIVGSVDAVPTVDPIESDALLVDLPSLLWLEQDPGLPTRDVSEYWFALEPGATLAGDVLTRPPVEAVEVESLRDRRRELTSNPAALGAIGALVVGFGAAAIFAVAGFVVTVTVSARERRSEFALLRALGLSGRDRRRWMMREQALLVVASAALGTLLGYALSQLILPVVSLSQDGSSVFPPVSVVVPWRRVAVLEVAVVAGLLVGVAGVAGLRGRTAVGSMIRTGGEP